MSLRAVALGQWVSGLATAAIPERVTQKMRDHLVDTIGAAIVGDGRDPVRVAETVFDAPGAVPLLINAPARELRDAVRVNAVAAHAAEIDDTEGCDHTGAIVVPVVLALHADVRFRLGGDELLRSMLVGYEVGRRMQLALGGYDAHNALGWHSTATCGVFAAAAAAAHALRLSPDECTAALAIAASSSAGGWAFAADGAMTKQLHVANAAGAGLQAALLARAGATGPTAIFDDVWGGFFTTHGGGSGSDNSATPDELLAGLGERWHSEHSAIKMYAACRSAHPPLDRVVDLLTASGITAADFVTAEISVSPLLRAMICPDSPRTVEAARMSLPLSIAFLLRGRPLDPDTYDGFEEPEVLALVARMHVVERADLPSPQYVEIVFTVETTTGRETHTVGCDEARGAEHAPFSAFEVREKFRSYAVPRVGVARADQLVTYVDALGGARGDASADPLPEIWA